MHLTTEFPPLIYGGLGTAVGALAAASTRCGIEVTILLVGSEGDPSYQRVAGREPEVGQRSRIRGWCDISVVPASHESAAEIGVRHARRWRPDALHLHSFWLWPVAEAIRQRTGVPIVYTVHSLDRAEYEIGEGPLECLTQWHIQECAVARADAVIALTCAEKDLIEEYLPGSRPRVHVVGNGIDVSGVPPGSVFSPQRVGDAVTILFSGRFVERKGVKELLAAIPRVLEGRPNVRVVLAGGYRGCGGEELARRWIGPELEPYRGRLCFPGWLDSEAMTAWYEAADVLVVPSWYEPFGMVVLEGMLHGLAVAASDIGGPREILEHEHTGLLIPPRDVPALADALCKLADSKKLRTRLGRAAAERVRHHWSYDKIVNDMSAVYSMFARNIHVRPAVPLS